MKKVTLLLFVITVMTGTAKAQTEWEIWRGEQTYGNWDAELGVTYNELSTVEAGDVIRGYITNVGDESNYPKVQFQFKQNADPWDYCPDEDKQYVDFNSSTTFFDISVTNEMLINYLNNNYNIVFGGAYYTLTKIVYIKKSTIKTVLTSQETTFGDWSGDLSIGTLPITATAGDYIYAKTKEVANDAQAQLECYRWDDAAQQSIEEYKKTFDIKADVWFALTDANATVMQTTAPTIKGKNYTVTETSLIHPIGFTIGASGLATFSANVDVTVPDGLEVYIAKDNPSNDNITISKVETTVIPANKGVILKGTEGKLYEFVTTTATSEQIALFDQNKLSANTTATVYSDLGDTGSTAYALYNEGSEAQFRKMNSGTLAANKAYLTISNSTNPAKITITYDGETTSLHEIDNKQFTTDNDTVYDLSGRKISNFNSQSSKLPKGVYIKNGKKFIVK